VISQGCFDENLLEMSSQLAAANKAPAEGVTTVVLNATEARSSTRTAEGQTSGQGTPLGEQKKSFPLVLLALIALLILLAGYFVFRALT
jgi:hypothetical protein